jgi:hypothetical protein
MFRSLTRVFAFMGIVVGSVALAQPPQGVLPQPRITSVFPSGCQRGEGVEIIVNGTDLDDATELLFSHPGIKAEVVIPPEPKDPKADPKKAPAAMNKKKGPPPASVKFAVKVAKDVPLGQHDVRISNRFGVSNPRSFVIGDRLEINEIEPNDDAIFPEPTGSLAGGPGTMPPANRNIPRAQRVELGTVINGVINSPTDVDYSCFYAKAGQRVLIQAQTGSIDSRARLLVEVYDLAGKRLALNRNYAGTDSLCDVILPADGDYFVRVSEFAYQQGGPDYFYRLTVGAGPWIDSVFPNVVNPGKKTEVTIYGRGLPGSKPAPGMQIDGKPLDMLNVTIDAPPNEERFRFNYRGRVAPPMALLDAFEYRFASNGGSSNGVPIFLSDNPIHLEKEGNDKHDTAEAIPVPCDVVGRIDKRYDRDYYSFNGKKGDVYQIELFAERLGSPCDLYIRVRNDKNLELAGDNDDTLESLHPVTFFTRSIDPQPIKFTVPYDGKMLILVGSNDANVSYGARTNYRLRVTPPKPDFRAIVMPRSRELPAATIANAEGETALDVFVDRQDGLTAPVTITAQGLPVGVTAQPATVGTGMKWGTLVLSGNAGLKDYTGPIKVTCTATIDGKPVVREARPASITWGIPGQQNVPTVTRLDQQLMLAVRNEKATFRITTDLKNATVKTKDKDGKDKDEKVNGPIFVKPSDKLIVPLKITWQGTEARPNALNLQAEATQQNMQTAPVTINNGQTVNLAKEKNDTPITIDIRNNAAPGTYSIVIRGDTQIQYMRDPSQKDKKAPATVVGYAAPVEVTVLPTSLAKVTATPGPMKLGTTAELTVKVERLAEFTGEYKLEVVLPKDVKGLTVKPSNIPAGKDEVKLVIEIAKDAKPGNVPNVLVQVTGTVHGRFPILTETKLNLTITK